LDAHWAESLEEGKGEERGTMASGCCTVPNLTAPVSPFRPPSRPSRCPGNVASYLTELSDVDGESRAPRKHSKT
jgi:hypothetical protein